MNIKPDFYVHWIWTATFGILALSGFVLMGARYGWMMNYAVPVADYLHRTLAALFTLLLAASVLMEILRILTDFKISAWMMVGTEAYQVFTLLTTLLLIISGLFIWVCMEWSPAALTFSMIVHEIVSFLAVASIIWHIYQKSHSLRI